MNILLALSLLLQAAAAPAPAPAGSVSGHVYGLDTGAPLKRAQVTLHSQGRRDGVRGGGPRSSEPYGTSTDAQGFFQFQNLPAGSYAIQCGKTGYISAGYGQRSTRDAGALLILADGQQLRDIDIRLVRAGVVSGTVVDEDGEPLARANVQLLARRFLRGHVQATPSVAASTDDRGQYRIFNVPPGKYYAQASLGEFGSRNMTYAPALYPNATSLREAQRIDIINGNEVSRIDFTLRPAPTYSLSGKVFDRATGQPLAGGFVSVMGNDLASGRFGGGTQVSPDGSFYLRGLAPGRYRLMINTRVRGGGPEGESTRPTVRSLDLGAANIDNLMIVVGPGPEVRGHVLVDGDTAASQSLRVWLSPKGDTSPFATTPAAMTKDSAFIIANVQPGEYYVSASGGASAGQRGAASDFYLREVRHAGQNIVEGGLIVPEGVDTVDLELLVDSNGGSLAGRAVNENGEPLAGVQVVMLAADPPKRESDRYFRTTATDPNGQFSVRGLVPGDYLALAWPDADGAVVQDPDVLEQVQRYAARVRIERAATATQDLRLPPELRALAQNLVQ
jgi:hypothetical protein